MIIIILLVFLVLLNCLAYFFVIRKQNLLDEKIGGTMINQYEDFFKKMEFLFNKINQDKESVHKQTMNTLDPLNKSLETMRSKIEDMEKSRITRELTLQNNIKNLMDLQNELHKTTTNLGKETSKVVNSFKNPSVRGKWGEIQLKRIAEISGMLPFCEFETQVVIGEIRPDMVIKLPNEGTIFVDAKNPMEAYLQYLDSDDVEKFKKDNLKAIKNHINSLSRKEYWSASSKSPQFVVMFIPIEMLWLKAMEEDSSIIEYTTQKDVIVATPMTLIGLLKVIAFGWDQIYINKKSEKLKEMIQKVRESLQSIEKTSIEIFKIHGAASSKINSLLFSLNEINKSTKLDEIQ